jgi:hypothetical protein
LRSDNCQFCIGVRYLCRFFRQRCRVRALATHQRGFERCLGRIRFGRLALAFTRDTLRTG